MKGNFCYSLYKGNNSLEAEKVGGEAHLVKAIEFPKQRKTQDPKTVECILAH
jgi:hypothetical protein